jgi:hypothetical protein
VNNHDDGGEAQWRYKDERGIEIVAKMRESKREI